MLFDDNYLPDPYGRYAQWRDKEPIWWDEGNSAWVLSRFEDVRAAFKDAETFSSKAMAEGPKSAIALPLLTDDPPRHTKLRALVNRAFTTRALKDMEAGVESLARQMVNDLDASAEIDISKQLTIPLPIAIIARLMGIPQERAEDFKRWSDAVTMTADMNILFLLFCPRPAMSAVSTRTLQMAS